MVRAIVGVASSMGIKTVAESVADDETIRLLEEYGVDYAQGFHIGRPELVAVPVADVGRGRPLMRAAMACSALVAAFGSARGGLAAVPGRRTPRP